MQHQQRMLQALKFRRERKSKRYAAQLTTKDLILQNTLSPEEMAKLLGVYDDYQVAHLYKVGDLFVYNDALYEVIQEHTSQEDWVPPENPALYNAKTPEGVIGAWVQPAGAHDAYALGDLVTHNDQIWVSIIADNVWEPGVYGWELYTA